MTIYQIPTKCQPPEKHHSFTSCAIPMKSGDEKLKLMVFNDLPKERHGHGFDSSLLSLSAALSEVLPLAPPTKCGLSSGVP